MRNNLDRPASYLLYIGKGNKERVGLILEVSEKGKGYKAHLDDQDYQMKQRILLPETVELVH